jgi:hypothetical protein
MSMAAIDVRLVAVLGPGFPTSTPLALAVAADLWADGAISEATMLRVSIGLPYPAPVLCWACHGTGWISTTAHPGPCVACHGEGVPCESCSRVATVRESITTDRLMAARSAALLRRLA